MRYGYIMSPWLFNLYTRGVEKEMNGIIMGRSFASRINRGGRWEAKKLSLTNETSLIHDSKEKLKMIILKFEQVMERRNLKMSLGKNKVMR